MVRRKLKVLLDQAKNLNQTRILLVSFLASACLFMTAFGLYTQLRVQVSINLDGIEQEVRTQAQTVEQLLQELQVPYTEHDLIEPGIDTEITAGMHIAWKKAVHITFYRYGEEEAHWTTADTVEEFLQEIDLQLQEGDILSLEPHSEMSDSMSFELNHLAHEIVDEEQVVPYQTIRKNDSALLQGEEKVVTRGKAGKAKHQFLLTLKNGVVIERRLVETTVIEERRDEIIAVGTKTAVSRGNYIFSPRSILENVVLTAYSAGVVSTGKQPGDSGYGITRSGSTATQGRTIAVDPNVIPLGTWVYIEGIGLRRAEDTGSAIKGKKIDLYFDDHTTATKFGRKKGFKVYIIGKKKPDKK